MSKRLLPVLLTAVSLCWVLAAVPARAGDIEGQVELALPGVALAGVGPIVVYLESDADLRGLPVPAPRRIRQKGAKFSPDLVAIGAGQALEFFNDDSILHNVFSYSKIKPFDLGLARTGSARTVTFDRPGVVQVYCSIHASMTATVFVAPSPFHAAVDAAGRFALRDVPVGSYRLRAWCPKLPDAKPTAVQVADGKTARVVVRLGTE